MREMGNGITETDPMFLKNYCNIQVYLVSTAKKNIGYRQVLDTYMYFGDFAKKGGRDYLQVT